MSSPLVEVPADALDYFHRYPAFIILGHIDPDADCIGSQLALTEALRGMGKNVVAANPGPFDRIEIAPFEERFVTSIDRADLPDECAAVVLDCSSLDRTGKLGEVVEGLPLAVIDHHRPGEVTGDVRFVRPEVPAATILVTSLLEALSVPFTEELARLLFLGLATDTGFFRFLESDQTIAFETAAFLARRGAAPRSIAQQIESGRHFDSRLLLARMINRTEQLLDGKVLLTFQTRADEREFGSRRDSDALYRLLTAVEGVRVVVVAKEKPEGCAVSFRSTDDTDVAALAATLGGGGHRNASGALIRTDLDQALLTLRNLVRTLNNDDGTTSAGGASADAAR